MVDPDAATSLVILTGSKTGALVALVRALDRGLPTSGDLPGDTLEYRGHRHPIVHFDQVVEWNTNWGLDNASVIANYLESRQPQKELDALRDALDALRAGLAKYFRLDDVLLAVGDERLNTYAWYLPGVRPGAK